jgi:hypothetical protein
MPYHTPQGAGFSQPPQVLNHDQPCRRCGYNLRGLSTNHRCPECGTPVGLSYHGEMLQFSDPTWLDTLHKGSRTFVYGVAVIFFGVILTLIVGVATSPLTAQVLGGLTGLAGWILITLGWWFMTEPDPSGLGENQYGVARQIIRIALIVSVAQQLLEILARVFAGSETATIGLRVVAFVLGIVGVVGAFAQLNYLKKLALRIPDEKLSNRANFLMYALGISYGVLLLVGAIAAFAGGGRAVTPSPSFAAFGCVAIGLVVAVIVFAIMYLLLVERMGKRFKEQAQIARSTWAAAAFAPRATPT